MSFLGKLFKTVLSPITMLFGGGGRHEYRPPEQPKMTARDLLPSTNAQTPEAMVLGASGMEQLRKKRGRSSLTINRDMGGGYGNGTGLNI